MDNFKSFGSLWEHEVFGTGDEIMLAFHGFDNHRDDFKVFEPTLGKRYKIISFQLPFHGKTAAGNTNKDLSYTKEDLSALFDNFFTLNSINRFSLMGYSLGGKVALQLIELFPEQVNTVILFAPDGIKDYWENRFVVNTLLGKKVYRQIIHNPSGLFRIMKMLKTLKLINPKLSDFVHNQLSTREKRQLVWDIWYCFRKIKPDIIHIQNIINTKSITIHLFFGKYDNIIPPSIGKGFVRGLENKSVLHIIDAGHNLIREKTNAELLHLL